MDPNTAVTGEENIYFEMESTAIAVVQATASERPLPVPKQTSCEKCLHEVNSDRHALAELENICRSNTVIIRRMWFILTATVAVLLTAVATLVLVTLMVMKSTDCAATQGKLQNLCIPKNVHV